MALWIFTVRNMIKDPNRLQALVADIRSFVRERWHPLENQNRSSWSGKVSRNPATQAPACESPST